MLTSYLVHCPHHGCNWFGSILPRGNSEAWRAYNPALSIVEFECPRCQGHWHAHVVGDDVEALPEQEEAALPFA